MSVIISEEKIMVKTKIISSLEKCFLSQRTEDFETLGRISALKNEKLSFQFIYRAEGEEEAVRRRAYVTIEGELAKYATVRAVELIPSCMPTYVERRDDNYLSYEAGLYPDLLRPISDGRVFINREELRSVWITVDTRGEYFGESELKVKLNSMESGRLLGEASIKIKIIDRELPAQKLKFTQWFYTDCLATHYDCEVFSERWWDIVEKFIKAAVRNGINMLLTPIFTPPLDTHIGTERPTVQLVDVTVTEGGYEFGFEKLDRWLDLCAVCGIEYYEISHFFTQWGAAHAPKVMATVDGEYKKIFGWDTDAVGEEYNGFLYTFIPAFIAHMKARGEDKKCFFHISDEPKPDNLEQYKRSRNSVISLLDGYTVMDALSNYEFYEQGIVSTPIPANNHIKPFLENGVPNLWTYYCCSQTNDVSNRFFAMPSYRTRCIGYQMYKFDIVGFLHWGFNFYYSQGSLEYVNPYQDSTGRYFSPSGDTYSVYPAENGEALDSLRAVVFYDALQDMRAFELCGELYGKEKTIAAIEEAVGEISFYICPRSASPILAMREKINKMIEAKI